MARALTDPAMTDELRGTVLRPVLLAKLAFDSGDLNLWTGLGNINFSGDNYTGVGNLGTVSQVEESLMVKSAVTTLNLSGIPASFIATALAEEYSERFAKLWLGMLDSSQTLIVDPFLMLTGRMDVMRIEEGGDTAVISLSVVNRMIDFELPKTRLYTPEDQKEHFPGDLGLDFTPALNDGRQVIWGKV